MKDELITMTTQLISFDTTSPEGNEYLCQKYLTQEMKKLGMKVSIISKNKKRPNIIGEIGNSKKSLVIACHMDVVAAGSGWKSNPFKAKVVKNKIYGRGAIDNKGPFAIAYQAVKQFIKKHPNFKGKIYLVALADEEDDNIHGVKFLLKNGFKADAALIPDGGYFSKLDIGEKGCLQLKIESFGKQAHSALEEKGENAVNNLSELVNRLNKLKINKKYNKLFTPLRVNISKFHGGEIGNTIPAYAYCQTDIRFPLGISSKEVLKKVELLTKVVKGKFKTVVLYKTEPHLVTNKRLIKSFLAAGKKLNESISTITLAGNSVGKEFTQAKIPSIVHYPMNHLPIHEPDEYIEISSMIKTTKLYFEFLKEYFNATK